MNSQNYRIERASGHVIARGKDSPDGRAALLRFDRLERKLGGWMECCADGGENDGEPWHSGGNIEPRQFVHAMCIKWNAAPRNKFICRAGMVVNLLQRTKDRVYVEVETEPGSFLRTDFPRTAFMRATRKRTQAEIDEGLPE